MRICTLLIAEDHTISDWFQGIDIYGLIEHIRQRIRQRIQSNPESAAYWTELIRAIRVVDVASGILDGMYPVPYGDSPDSDAASDRSVIGWPPAYLLVRDVPVTRIIIS